MLTHEQEGWLKHCWRAYVEGTLSYDDYVYDAEDVRHDIPPRRFLRAMEGRVPVYGDSRVPFEWH